MKLAILTNHFPPVLDGVGDYAFALATELRQTGHDVAVLCRRVPAIAERRAAGGFAVTVYPDVPAWNHRAVVVLRRFLRAERPDWLLVQYVPNGFDRRAMPVWLPRLVAVAQAHRVRVSITFHELFVRPAYWPPHRALVAGVQRWICRQMARRADACITSTDHYVRLLKPYARRPVHQIPIGANLRPGPLTDAEIRATRQQLAPNGEALMSTFGLRNQDLLLRVFAEVLRRQPHTRLLICSVLNVSPALRNDYDRLRDNIVVTGFMDGPGVYRHLRASDVFFLPDSVNARGEGGTCQKSTALATGLAAGLPVVGTRGDMTDSQLLTNRYVRLGNAHKPDELAELILTALTAGDGRPPDQALAIDWNADFGISWSQTIYRYMSALTLAQTSRPAQPDQFTPARQ